MKKYASFLFVLILVLLIPVSCLADTTINIDKYGFSVSMPNYTYTLSQDTEPSSPVWSFFNLDPEQYLQHMKDNNIYLDSCSRDFTYEIILIANQEEKYTQIFNLNLYKDDEILKLFSTRSDEAEKLGLTLEEGRIYSSGGIKYFADTGTQTSNNQTNYFESYITVVNGILIQLTIRSYAGPLTDKNKETSKAVVDSIKFKELLKKPASASSSNPAIFSSKGLSSSLTKGLESAVGALIIIVVVRLFKGPKKKDTEEVRKNTIASNNAENDNSFFCTACGTTSTGWYQTCPHCGAVGKMKKTDKATNRSQEKEANLDEPPIIFFCKECQAVFGGTLKVKPEKCPKCGGVVVETTVLRDDWRSLTNEGKIQLKKELSEGRHWKDSTLPEPIEAEKTSTDVDESKTDKSVNQQLFHLKSLKDAGIITQEEFDAKKKQILTSQR